jgi:large subunit ribosomal protein L4
MLNNKYMEQASVTNQPEQSKVIKISDLSLNPDFWQAPLSNYNVSLASRCYLANRRQGTKKTKQKGEVAGGGAKPWRQKGTGRARSGSIRNPQFRGGGVVFGPTGRENYSLAMNKKFKRKVLISLLSEKMRSQKITVVERITLANYKTKEAVKFLTTISLN